MWKRCSNGLALAAAAAVSMLVSNGESQTSPLPGTGLRGEYFDNADLSASRLVRLDPAVSFSWGAGSPDPSIAPDTFSARWTGQIEPLSSELHTFYVDADDGVRLWIAGQLVIDSWSDQPATEHLGTVMLTAGQKADIRLEYYENTGLAGVRLSWSSPSQFIKTIVPRSRLYPPAADGSADAGGPPGAVGRPRSNTGTGFFVVNRTIYDANGAEFRLRGVNNTHWWGGDTRSAIPSIAKAGANAVRTVFGPDMGATTSDERRAIAQLYIDQGIVPVVEYHSATCAEDAASLASVVDLWVGPDKDWLKSLERYVILNIANEWGPNSTVWRDAYIDAVSRLRLAGVKNLLVIDAGGACGQLAESVEAWGRAIFDSDPERNIAFSVHMYGFWHDPGATDVGAWDGRQPYDIDAELGRLDATGLPIIVGEFSWNGFNQVGYTTRSALATYEKHGVGWIAWMWHNPGGDGTADLVTGLLYNSSTDLTDFGHLVVEDPNFGLRAVAKRATIFP
jgi:mannan endo-1,4-beta-mannosidase